MTEKAKLKSKFAYGISDFASNLSWGTVGSYLMIYYTDVAKISAVAIGTMFLITRIWDAINDPIMGMIIDKTHTRWGKCRPYFLWMCVPLAILMVLTYSVPEISATGKLIYAYVTFTLLSMIYTAINIPVTAILPRLTANIQERTMFGTFRGFGAMIGGTLVGVITLPLVKNLGGGNDALGYRLTMVVYGIIAVIMFLFTFFNVKELAIDDSGKKTSFTEGFKAVKGNLPWLITLLIGVILFLTMAMRGAGLVYYCRYNLGNDSLVPLLSMLMILMFVPMSILPVVTKKIGKRNTMLMGNMISLVGYGLIWFSGTSVPLLVTGNIIGTFGLGFIFTLTFVMIADTVDYGEWKNGVRSEGFLSAAASFGQKLGTGIGGACAAWILGAGGYDGGAATQSRTALIAISVNYVVVPILGCVIAIALLLCYKLDKLAPQMMKELAERRAKAAM
jgi:GPH family glycoside/pentoside/hexuronide:cation symporter